MKSRRVLSTRTTVPMEFGLCHSPGIWMSLCSPTQKLLQPIQLGFLWRFQPPAPLPSLEVKEGLTLSSQDWFSWQPAPIQRPPRGLQPPIISLAYKETHIMSEQSKGFRNCTSSVPGKGIMGVETKHSSYYVTWAHIDCFLFSQNK